MVTQIKILLGVAAILMLAAAVVGGFYMFEKVFRPAYDRDKEAQALLSAASPPIDLGQPVHQQAIDCIAAGDLAGAREKFAQIIEVYPESAYVAEARRALGEMNLDRLFSKSPMPGKLEYTVKSGDALAAIASRNRTTIAYIRHVNGLFSNVIHPGDRLVLYPFAFELIVDLKHERLMLWENGRFMKDYPILEYRHPQRGSFPGKTRITDKLAWKNGRTIRLTDSDAGFADIWLQTPPRSTQPGVVICAPPEGEEASRRDESIAFGVFLSRADIDELAVLTRVGTPVSIEH